VKRPRWTFALIGAGRLEEVRIAKKRGVSKMPEAILFENANFHGQHKHVFGPEPNLNAPDDNFFNDKVSSLVFLRSESWKFYRDAGFNTPYPPTLGPVQGPDGYVPGRYPFVANVEIKNDDMSSLQPA
jgi:hypothetical protein